MHWGYELTNKDFELPNWYIIMKDSIKYDKGVFEIKYCKWKSEWEMRMRNEKWEMRNENEKWEMRNEKWEIRIKL